MVVPVVLLMLRAKRVDPRQKSSKEPETEMVFYELSQEVVSTMCSCSVPVAAVVAQEFQCRNVALQLESLVQVLAQVQEVQVQVEVQEEKEVDQCHR